MKNYGPISARLPRMLHGGDYNPEQWLDDPRVLSEDIRMMKLAGWNTVSVGIFSWSVLEPAEGRYELDWLSAVIDRLHDNGILTVLATPSGARPAWMAENYPEVLRVGSDMRRALFSGRHNHCFTSPVYRDKVARINTRLSERFSRHPGVILWHISNEYSGECHCNLCEEAFRGWLKKRYADDLGRLNHAWWTTFWSHTFTDWRQIRSPSALGEGGIHGLNLDWKRFVTYQTVDFMKAEIAAVGRSAPQLPVTSNFMGTFPGLDYWKLVPHLDVVGWDNYPLWHGTGPVNHPWASWDAEGRDWRTASDIGFLHDLYRSFKGGKPFLVIESSPSVMSWSPALKLKRPGMHLLSSLQGVAHGSDSVQYFQWRKGRGGWEKFHGAVVDASGREDTRIFSDVAEVGRVLSKLDDVVGTGVPIEVAILFDWENRWAIDDSQGPLNDGRKLYDRTCRDHYYPLWSMGIPADIIEEDCDFSPYKLLIAPMLYLLKNGVAERLEKFVQGGGTLVGTYWSGIADETDLCFQGGVPGPLRKLFGIWSEEIDALYAVETRSISLRPGNPLGMKGSYAARDLCDLVHLESAEELAVYDEDFYKGRPALTANGFGKGSAYYMASRNEDRFLTDFYASLVRQIGLSTALPTAIPEGISVRIRRDEKNVFLFLMNFKPEQQQVDVEEGRWTDVVSGARAHRTVRLAPYGVTVLRRQAG
jgi:beta-galactosidase